MEVKITNLVKELPELHVGMIVQIDGKYDCIIVFIDESYELIDLKDGYAVTAGVDNIEDIRNRITKYYNSAEIILK